MLTVAALMNYQNIFHCGFLWVFEPLASSNIFARYKLNISAYFACGSDTTIIISYRK